MKNFHFSTSLLCSLSGTAVVLPLFSSCSAQKKAEAKPYNIVYIMTDDHTAQMMSCYDRRYIETPNLDRIAADGVRFTNSFVANSLSGPSRACMLTGKHSHANGFTDNTTCVFDGSQQTMPKLLQQAYLHKWKPLCMAEFWWGRSPVNEIREHGRFYPACTSKCGPILKHMLQGLDVEENPLKEKMSTAPASRLRTVYEDEWLLIVDKPAGLLSVPGRETDAPSVLSLMHSRLPQAKGPLVVHRLDMDTSGLMLIAKTADVHRRLQALFETRAVEKEYIALLQGTVTTDSGLIDLPLGPSPHHRPCQEVRAPHAKPAQTRYEVLEHREGRTLVRFRPLTGRTHQLRVHAAHTEGLGCPIVGDPLYGTPADRLYLHARSLRFVHPVTGQEVQAISEAEF